jgi:plasmid stability protein
MGSITVRRIDDDVIARLKAKAKASGRSMEEEVRLILGQAAGKDRLSGQAAVDHFTKLQREVFGDRVLPSSVPLIREMREADPTKWDGK